MVKTLAEAVVVAMRTFAAEPSAIEVEIAMVFGSVWIGRDGEIYDRPRFAN